MAKKRAAKKRKAGAQTLIRFVRMPKGTKVTVTGPRSAQLARILKDAGLNPAARCFGGDTCIV